MSINVCTMQPFAPATVSQMYATCCGQSCLCCGCPADTQHMGVSLREGLIHYTAVAGTLAQIQEVKHRQAAADWLQLWVIDQQGCLMQAWITECWPVDCALKACVFCN